jgi:hypothetical protein
MLNSNSTISWLIARSGLNVASRLPAARRGPRRALVPAAPARAAAAHSRDRLRTRRRRGRSTPECKKPPAATVKRVTSTWVAPAKVVVAYQVKDKEVAGYIGVTLGTDGFPKGVPHKSEEISAPDYALYKGKLFTASGQAIRYSGESIPNVTSINDLNVSFAEAGGIAFDCVKAESEKAFALRPVAVFFAGSKGGGVRLLRRHWCYPASGRRPRGQGADRDCSIAAARRSARVVPERLRSAVRGRARRRPGGQARRRGRATRLGQAAQAVPRPARPQARVYDAGLAAQPVF